MSLYLVTMFTTAHFPFQHILLFFPLLTEAFFKLSCWVPCFPLFSLFGVGFDILSGRRGCLLKSCVKSSAQYHSVISPSQLCPTFPSFPSYSVTFCSPNTLCWSEKCARRLLRQMYLCPVKNAVEMNGVPNQLVGFYRNLRFWLNGYRGYN